MKQTKTTSDTQSPIKTRSIAKKKIAHNSTEAPAPAKPVRVLEEFIEFGSWLNKPLTNAYLDRLASEFVEWAKNDPDALRPGDFFLRNNIPERYMNRWKETYPVMAEAVGVARSFIASRRERGAIRRDFDAGMIKTMQHWYDDSWRSAEEWRAALGKEHERQGNIKVVIEQFPSSDLVPEKRNE